MAKLSSANSHHKTPASSQPEGRADLTKRQLLSFVRILPDAAIVFDTQGQICAANALAARAFGYPRSKLAGKAIQLLLPSWVRGEDESKRAGEAGTFVGVRQDGATVALQVKARPIVVGRSRLTLATIHDESEVTRLEEKLAERETIYKAVVENIADAVVINVGATRTFVNAAYLKLHGLSDKSEALGLPVDHFVLPQDRKLVTSRTLARQKGSAEPGTYEYRIRRTDGEVRTIETSAVKITHNGRPAALAVLRDVTDREMFEARLAELANFDALTAALNRRAFSEELARSLADRRQPLGTALLILDVDGFQRINDRHGHKTGDEYLAQLALTVRGRLRTSDVLGRLGGDEFAILLSRTTAKQAQEVAERVLSGVRSLALLGDKGIISATVTVGIAVAPRDTSSPQDLLHYAELAMNLAKGKGGDQVAVYRASAVSAA